VLSRVIAGRYAIQASLGRGGMGEVFLAQDQLLQRRVAIKEIRSGRESGLDSVAVERLIREARLAAGIQHPHVVAVHDLIVENNQTFIVMEYLEARSLAEMIRTQTRLDLATVAGIGSQIAGALETAHRAGIIHRDVKPSNILVTAAGNAKLADFGVARGAADSNLTGTGMMIGSIAFMSPEVAKGDPATHAADIFSLGCTLYAAIEGHPPFADITEPTNSMRTLVRLVSETAPAALHAGPLQPLLARMLDPDPRQRPSAGETQRLLVATTFPVDHPSPMPVAVEPPATALDSQPPISDTSLQTVAAATRLATARHDTPAERTAGSADLDEPAQDLDNSPTVLRNPTPDHRGTPSPTLVDPATPTDHEPEGRSATATDAQYLGAEAVSTRLAGQPAGDIQTATVPTIPIPPAAASGFALNARSIAVLGLVGGAVGTVVIEGAQWLVSVDSYIDMIWWSWPWPVFAVVLSAGLLVRARGAIAATAAWAAAASLVAQTLMWIIGSLVAGSLPWYWLTSFYAWTFLLGDLVALAIVAAVGELLGLYLWTRPNNLHLDLLIAVPAILGVLAGPWWNFSWDALVVEPAAFLSAFVLEPWEMVTGHPVSFLGLVVVAFLTCGLIPAALARKITRSSATQRNAAASVTSDGARTRPTR
jgi:serine/threonine protein kinase